MSGQSAILIMFVFLVAGIGGIAYWYSKASGRHHREFDESRMSGL
jgi:hypothetical protein